MPIKSLITLPNPMLREVSKPVACVDSVVQNLIDDMLETMYDAHGIGLAAVQVGIPLRLLVVDIREPDTPSNPLVVINPEILWLSDERNVCKEGCLSIPEYFAEVERPKCLRIRYEDRNGKEAEIEADGLLATCLQHEIDHLNGRLFVDYLSKIKRDMVIRKFKKKEKNNTEEIL